MKEIENNNFIIQLQESEKHSIKFWYGVHKFIQSHPNTKIIEDTVCADSGDMEDFKNFMNMF